MKHLVRAVAVASCFAFALLPAAAQSIGFTPPPSGDPVAQDEAMAKLAETVIAAHSNSDRLTYLDDLFRAQIVAGRNQDALKSLAELEKLEPNGVSPRPRAGLVVHEIVARARFEASQESTHGEAALKTTLDNTIAGLDDVAASLVLSSLALGADSFTADFKQALARQKGNKAISLEDARTLIRDYELSGALSSLAPFVADIAATDDARRYIIDRDVSVRTRDGGTICALVVRPRAAAHPLPTLLTFTIYADQANNFADARQVASHGYAGVVGLTRGKGCSSGKLVPYVRDGADADTLIEWIARQPWSDGRVGIYGGSYSGGTSWAAAKHSPKALKAIFVGAPVAPGVDVPMEGDVAWSFVYPWPFYTTDNKYLDNATYNETARWDRLYRTWYKSGRAYRDLDKIDGTPNPIFDEWLAHPTFDSYWQGAIPYRDDFAQISIPVLQTAGYYAGGPGAAVYYMTQHYKYDPLAEDYLVIGPYDHFGAQRGTFSVLGARTTVLAGYTLDPAAQIDAYDDLRFKWFDYVLRGGPKPAILKDKVNYEVTGANVWKHAPSIDAMHDRSRRLYFGVDHVLSEKPTNVHTELVVNLANRRDADREPPGGGLLDKEIDTSNGIVFTSEPLHKPTELSGLFSGALDFVANKKDFDFQVTLYERTVQGEYFLLAPYWSRASNVSDITERHLLAPGTRTLLGFTSKRLMSHLLLPGSRIVAVLNVIKETGRQIDYGTGKDVSGETIADAGPPLAIDWFGDSYIDLPVGN